MTCERLHAEARPKSIAAPSQARLCEQLGLEAQRELPWVVDLTLGAWRPREAARQLAAQAGVTLPDLQGDASTELASWASVVGANIDAEARGPTEILIADRDARLLCPLIEQASADAALLIVWLSQSDELPDDSGWFIRLASERLTHAGARVVLARRSAGATTPNTPCLSPHLLDGAPIDPGAPYWQRLRCGQYLCCPSQRPLLPGVARGRFDQLAAQAGTPAWLRAYAWYFGNNYFVDSAALSDYAWECYAQGANALAMKLLQRAWDCARDSIGRATILARIQGIRIATQNFALAAAAPLPAAGLPELLSDFLRQSVGWACIMLGDTNGLSTYFGAHDGAAALSGEDLYAMNIHALGLVRAGQPDQALALELRIEAARQAQDSDDARLSYINNLNIARLYKQRGELASASAYYERAFATNHGTRSHAESMHAAWIRSSMARANGRAREAGGWLMQAVLHWLADPLPEAVPVRLAQAVLGTVPSPEARCESLCAALVTALARAMVADEFGCGVVQPAATLQPLVSIEATSAPQRYIGWGGFGLGWSATLAAVRRDNARAAVAAQVTGILRALGAPLGGTLVVDDQCRRTLPSTREELVALAVLRGTRTCTWHGQSATWDEAGAASLRRALVLSSGTALATFELDGPDAPHLRHHRHNLVQAVTPGVVALAALIARDGALAVTALDSHPQDIAQAWPAAWLAGAIEIALPEQACTQAGINWRTNAT